MRMLLRNFNSIKVRLEQRDLILNGSGLAKFQFHKGTIRTKYRSAFTYRRSDFNSIKVRLELHFILNKSPFYLFQFHKGTIRTRSGAAVQFIHLISIP